MATKRVYTGRGPSVGVVGYVDEPAPATESPHAVQLDLSRDAFGVSVLRYLSASGARVLAAELLAAADAIDAALVAARSGVLPLGGAV